MIIANSIVSRWNIAVKALYILLSAVFAAHFNNFCPVK